MACENPTSSCRCALHLPVEQIPWKRTTAAVIAGVIVAACASTADAAQRPTLDPTLSCTIHTVAAGDWMSKIAVKNGLTTQELVARNPHVPDPNRIWPGDELVLSCAPRKPVVSPTTTAAPTTTAPALEVNAMQAAPKPAPVVAWPGAMPFIPGEQVVDGVASQALILRSLYNAGARGNLLVGLAAVTEGESNRRLNAEGDHELRDATWDVSLTPWQIRGAKEQRGKGTARDVDALRADPLGHGAAAALEIAEAKLAQGRDPLSPWTAHLVGNDRSFVAPYTELAQKMGLLDGAR